MKKRLLILVILTMFFSVFEKENFTNTENGSYIPLRMYKTVETTKSYSEGIVATSSSEYYTVLCISGNKIISNLKFHDSFQLNENEVDFSFSSKNGKRFLTDNKTGIKYIKISNSTDYFAAYNDFLIDTVMKELSKKNSTIKINKSVITFESEQWEIDKDQWHYSENLQIILYSKSSRKYVGFLDNKAYSLKNGSDLKKILDN